jgi:hypothetical protein
LPPGTGGGLTLGEQAEETGMIDRYYWPTPNGHKIAMFLDEAGLDYAVHPVDISAADQFKPDFLAISPNSRMPAIVDTVPSDGGDPISVFESQEEPVGQSAGCVTAKSGNLPTSHLVIGG